MVKLTDVIGIGPATAQLLSERNIKTVEALASINLAELQKIPGFSDIRARTIKKAASDCLQNKADKKLTTATSNVEATVKKATTEKSAVSQAVNQAEPDKVKDKKKNKKDGEKKEKVKDRDKKNKDKDKKKDSKKKGKDKKKA